MKKKEVIVEYELTISKEEYIEMYCSSKRPIVKALMLTVVLAVGVICLLFSYTLILGIVIIGFCLFLIFGPEFIKGTIDRQYSDTKYLHRPIHYILSLDKIIIKSSNFYIETNWKDLYLWVRRGDWFVFSLSGLPRVIIPCDLILNSENKNEFLSVFEKYGGKVK